MRLLDILGELSWLLILLACLLFIGFIAWLVHCKPVDNLTEEERLDHYENQERLRRRRHRRW